MLNTARAALAVKADTTFMNLRDDIDEHIWQSFIPLEQMECLDSLAGVLEVGVKEEAPRND